MRENGTWTNGAIIEIQGGSWNNLNRTAGFSTFFRIWKVKSQSESCLVVWTLCNPMDYTVHGILQARILEYRILAFPFSRGSPQPRDWTQVLHCRQILYQLSHKGSPRRTTEEGLKWREIRSRRTDWFATRTPLAGRSIATGWRDSLKSP